MCRPQRGCGLVQGVCGWMGHLPEPLEGWAAPIISIHYALFKLTEER